jgi:hypothetical protein
MLDEASTGQKATFPAEMLESQRGHVPELGRCLNVVVGGGGGKEPYPDDIDETTQRHPPEPCDHRGHIVESEAELDSPARTGE